MVEENISEKEGSEEEDKEKGSFQMSWTKKESDSNKVMVECSQISFLYDNASLSVAIDRDFFNEWVKDIQEDEEYPDDAPAHFTMYSTEMQGLFAGLIAHALQLSHEHEKIKTEVEDINDIFKELFSGMKEKREEERKKLKEKLEKKIKDAGES